MTCCLVLQRTYGHHKAVVDAENTESQLAIVPRQGYKVRVLYFNCRAMIQKVVNNKAPKTTGMTSKTTDSRIFYHDLFQNCLLPYLNTAISYQMGYANVKTGKIYEPVDEIKDADLVPLFGDCQWCRHMMDLVKANKAVTATTDKMDVVKADKAVTATTDKATFDLEIKAKLESVLSHLDKVHATIPARRHVINEDDDIEEKQDDLNADPSYSSSEEIDEQANSNDDNL